MNRFEKLLIAVLAAGFFVGIWHGFPNVSLVTDEMFPGGVVKALQAHSIFPQGNDIPYGTVTYFINYLFIAPVLLIGLLFFKLNTEAFKFFLIDHTWIVYLLSRLISAAVGVLLLWIANEFLKKYAEYKVRLLLLTLLFSNMLVVTMFHTTKVWIISTALVVISFVYTVRVIESVFEKREYKQRDVGIAVICAFLALANFPLAGFSLMCIPFIGFVLWRHNIEKKAFWVALSIGAVIAVLFIAANAHGIQGQIKSIVFDYTLSENAQAHNASILQSVWLNALKTFTLFPLILLACAVSLWQGVKNKTLFMLSFAYAAVYFGVISFVARWSTDILSFTRYLLPEAFFLVFLTASGALTWNKKLLLPALVSCVFFIITLLRLLVPPTQNEVSRWVALKLNSSNAVIINRVGQDIAVPKNKKSYELIPPSLCTVKCQHAITRNLNQEFSSLVIDDQATSTSVFASSSQVYIVDDTKHVGEGFELLIQWQTNMLDSEPHTLDYNAVNYFDTWHFTLARYGKNVYIYRVIDPSLWTSL